MNLGNDQYGFRKGRGTRDATATLPVIHKGDLEYNNKVFVCYVYYEKAFDWVNWVKIMVILRNIGVDWKDKKLILNLYQGQAAYVRIDGFPSACSIGTGVRQEYSLSPLLY